MDVRPYLARLEADAPGPPSLEGLHVLHLQHLLHVPFENLDIHRGVPIRLEEEAVVEKIVRRRRGGFCYELNAAFAWLLRRLGYAVTLLSAEVARKEGGYGIPFDHMTLRVDLNEGAFLADVGFGDSFREPLRLAPGEESEQLGDVYRLRQQERFWYLERCPSGAALFQPQYRFTLAPRRLEEFAGGCHYHQTSPESTFTRGVICSRALADGRVTLHADRLVTTRGAERQQIPIASEERWHRVLHDAFGMELDPKGISA